LLYFSNFAKIGIECLLKDKYHNLAFFSFLADNKMSSKQTLSEIKKTEDKAQNLIEKAKAEGAAILGQAKQDAQIKIKKEEEALLQKKEGVLTEMNKEAEVQTQTILEGNQKEIAKIESQAEGRVEEAVSFVVSKIY